MAPERGRSSRPSAFPAAPPNAAQPPGPRLTVQNRLGYLGSPAPKPAGRSRGSGGGSPTPSIRALLSVRTDFIRNFCIIAHIDHGKSTLADRLLEATGTLDSRQMRDQVLDSNELERERGITIKLHAVRMAYRAKDGRHFDFNLIDTPGHVDFTYEVSRSLAACEGALLVVDATQGVQAQTLSNLFLALDADLEIVPVLNKIDLPGAEPERRRHEVADLMGIDPEMVLEVSAKEGLGVEAVLEAVVDRIPPPEGNPEAPLRALIFDSYYDQYLGAVPTIRVFDGTLRPGMSVTFGTVTSRYEVTEAGHLRLGRIAAESLGPGEVGYLVAAIKTVSDTKVGDTVLDAANPANDLLPGYQEAKPMVFAGLYPSDADDYEELRDALHRLQLNDASLHFEPETSRALGFGFRCGFLGLLHMEIVQERLDREFGVKLITTVPNVKYRVTMADGTALSIENPTDLPDRALVESVAEPVVRARIVMPATFIGNVQKLCHERRGVFKGMSYLDPRRVEMDFELPLAEIVLDFYGRLKGGTRGYASLDYELHEYRVGDLVKLDVMVNREPVDAFSVILHRDNAYRHGFSLVRKLKQLIPRQQFEVALQAAIGGQVIARQTVKPVRKNVTAKCYGGDITRKRKLLERQREGKKRMKQVGSVEIPQEAFMAVLQLDDDRS